MCVCVCVCMCVCVSKWIHTYIYAHIHHESFRFVAFWIWYSLISTHRMLRSIHYIRIYDPLHTGMKKHKVIFMGNLIQCFPFLRPVVIPKLKSPVFPTIYPYLSGKLLDSSLSEGINALGNVNSLVQDLNSSRRVHSLAISLQAPLFHLLLTIY